MHLKLAMLQPCPAANFAMSLQSDDGACATCVRLLLLRANTDEQTLALACVLMNACSLRPFSAPMIACIAARGMTNKSCKHSTLAAS